MLKLLLEAIYVLAQLHVCDEVLTYSPFDKTKQMLRRIEPAILIWHFLQAYNPILLQEGPNRAHIERPESVFTFPTILPCESREIYMLGSACALKLCWIRSWVHSFRAVRKLPGKSINEFWHNGLWTQEWRGSLSYESHLPWHKNKLVFLALDH